MPEGILALEWSWGKDIFLERPSLAVCPCTGTAYVFWSYSVNPFRLDHSQFFPIPVARVASISLFRGVKEPEVVDGRE